MTKRPTIRPVGIENLQVELFNNEQHIEIKGNVEGEEELLDLWEIFPAIRNNTPYLLVKGHVWYSITEDFRSRLRTLADIIDPRENTLCINDSHILTLNNILSHESIEAPTVLQEKMRGVQSVILGDSVFAYTSSLSNRWGKMDAEFKAMDIWMRFSG